MTLYPVLTVCLLKWNLTDLGKLIYTVKNWGAISVFVLCLLNSRNGWMV